MGLAERLRHRCADLWERMVEHPFVQELGAGTLPLWKFRRYFTQDYLYVHDLVRAVALAVARAPDAESARRLTAFQAQLLAGEEDLFRHTFAEWGLSAEEVARLEPAPTTLAYGAYFLRLAVEGGFPHLLTALTVSEWSYLDWADRLAGRGAIPTVPAYRDWIALHRTPEFREFVGWLQGRLDRLAAEGTPLEADLERVFRTTLRLEVRFWEMAYRGEPWPDEEGGKE